MWENGLSSKTHWQLNGIRKQLQKKIIDKNLI